MKSSPSPSAVTRAPEARPPARATRRTPAKPSPGPALALPLGCASALGGFGLLLSNRGLYIGFMIAAGVLLAWTVTLHVLARQQGRVLGISFTPRPHHWVQAIAQIVVLLYWGWHVRFVYAFIPLIIAQLIFAYGVDSLVNWSRRDRYAFGFGPFPVILSINLFLWFEPDWFVLQFAMIPLGYIAKELIRWKRDGRSAHIFNPSSFPLAVLSLGLIVTGTSDITLGTAIASSQFYPPYIYLVIFLAALPGQLLFGVARVTLSAVITLYGISVVFFAASGTYLFYDTHIPIAVFLGMHLLVTDPSTSPRSESGRILFGMLYGTGTAVFYVALGALGVPTFYDKLLPVPLMNLLVRRIDRLAASGRLALLDPSRLVQALTPLQGNAAYTSIWGAAFLALSVLHGVGDNPPGQSLPAWYDACRDGSTRACEYAVQMTRIYCDNGSGWACNEWGIRQVAAGRPAGRAFERACALGFAPACENVGRPGTNPEAFARGRPLLADLPIVLRGTKPPLRGRSPAELYARACEQGWPGACDGWGADGRAPH